MVVHDFVCDDCNISVQDTDTRESHVCSGCGKNMRWDLIGIGIQGNYRFPVHSDALAINPNQRAEHEQMFPNIRIDKQNRPIFENGVDHQNYLDKCNLVKNRQKIKPKSNR